MFLVWVDDQLVEIDYAIVMVPIKNVPRVVVVKRSGSFN